jgi:protein-S-isoprenylcysteine O-methyltransferase Ste14
VNFILEELMENLLRWAAVFALGASMTISVYYRRRAARSGERINHVQEEGQLMVALRVVFGLALWISALLYLIYPAWLAWSQVSLPLWLRWVGAGIMVVCVPLFYWLFSSLDRNITGTTAIRKNHSLVTSGPYRYVRHPLYSVGLLAFCGFTLLTASWWIAFLVFMAAVYLVRRTPQEEARLIERFGAEYKAYMQQTGRYLPRLYNS